MLNRLVNTLLILLFSTLSGAAFYYHAETVEKDIALQTLRQEHHTALAQIQTMEKQHAQLNVLDRKYTEELTHAKTQLAALERDINDKQRRVQLNATCPQPLSQATAPTGLDDGTRARLNDTAIKHYFHLRERIDTATQQIAGLQDYIRQVCLKAEG